MVGFETTKKYDPKKSFAYVDGLYLNCSDDATEQIVTSDNEFYFLPCALGDVWYISGPRGAGKSFLSDRFANVYNDIYPDNDIYLISGQEKNDETSFKSDIIKWIDLESLKKLDMKEITDMFRNSLVIFDDISEDGDKFIVVLILELINKSRKKGTSVVVTTHIPCQGKFSSKIIDSANKIAVFPTAASYHSVAYLLSHYFRYKNKHIDEILTRFKGTRYIIISKDQPPWIAGQKRIEFI